MAQERLTPAQLRLATGKNKRGGKYGVSARERRTGFDGTVYDSRGEMLRHEQLLWMERGGLVRNLRRQVVYELAVGGVHITRYTADFVYEELPPSWKKVVEDFKSAPTRTEAYGIRKRLMLALHGIEIRETNKEGL